MGRPGSPPRSRGWRISPVSRAVVAWTIVLMLSTAARGQVRFSDATGEVGIGFRHENGASPEKHLPETMGSGVVIWDFDNDGWPDVYFADGGTIDSDPAGRPPIPSAPRLYRNAGGGTFIEVSQGRGLTAGGYGMGACAADVDNDGWTDLYVTGVGGNRLWGNSGDGTFVDRTSAAGVGAGDWSTSCAFADIDNDGDVDLYVARYVDWSVENNRHCTNSTFPAYCHPNVYDPVPDLLYVNRGDGTFVDRTSAAGIAPPASGNGLGVVFSDYDGDGWVDIYVANDAVANFLFHNRGDGTFEETAFIAGVAVGNDGQPQAGMGTDMADVDGDGQADAIVTNLDKETHAFYVNLGGGLFADRTLDTGIARATLPFVGFGVALVDFDNDTDLDVAIANGDVIDNVELYRDDTSYEQRNLLLENDGTARFHDVSTEAGSGFELRKVSRGLAVGDLDNDGDVDLVVSNNGQTADVLRNDGGARGNALLVRLRGTDSNRDGIGARVTLSMGGRGFVREVKAGSGYLGQNDLRLHFGLGDRESADELEIRWPSGTVDVIGNVRANRILTITEGDGITDDGPLADAGGMADFGERID